MANDKLLAYEASHRRSSKEHHGERERVPETNFETQLLEAKRKRLLRQQDWIGIDSSKPAHLQLLSKKEKDRIGKRRKIQVSSGDTARLKTSAKIIGRLPQSVGNAYDGILLAGTTRNNLDNIHIRIGTDALTTTYSNQLDACIQSQASSDPMLFDQDRRDAERVRQSESVQPVNQQRRSATRASQHSSAASYVTSFTDEYHLRYRGSKYYRDSHSTKVASDQNNSTYGQYNLQPQILAITKAPNHASQSSDLGYRITHHTEGNERPLRLLFGNPTFPVSTLGRITAQNSMGEVQYVHETLSARAPRKGYMRQADSDRELSIIDEGSAALAIVDEEPWKTLLAISDGSSSHSTTAIDPGNSLLRSDPAALNNEAVTNWSQRTTKGDQTRISLSCISASLPSLKRGVEQYGSEHRFDKRFDRQVKSIGTKSRGVNEDERLWRAFVFGSDENPSSETHQDIKQGKEHLMSTTFEEASSRYLPSSIAVRSVSSTPFKSISRLASCISDNVQDAAANAPPPGSRTINSPAFHKSSGDLNEELFGERSVTHASMQNNASCDTTLISSKFSSDTQTSRSSLDRPDRTRDMVSKRYVASTRKAALSCSSGDIPVSYDESSGGLDLVDPNGLT